MSAIQLIVWLTLVVTACHAIEADTCHLQKGEKVTFDTIENVRNCYFNKQDAVQIRPIADVFPSWFDKTAYCTTVPGFTPRPVDTAFWTVCGIVTPNARIGLGDILVDNLKIAAFAYKTNITSDKSAMHLGLYFIVLLILAMSCKRFVATLIFKVKYAEEQQEYANRLAKVNVTLKKEWKKHNDARKESAAKDKSNQQKLTTVVEQTTRLVEKIQAIVATTTEAIDLKYKQVKLASLMKEKIRAFESVMKIIKKINILMSDVYGNSAEKYQNMVKIISLQELIQEGYMTKIFLATAIRKIIHDEYVDEVLAKLEKKADDIENMEFTEEEPTLPGLYSYPEIDEPATRPINISFGSCVIFAVVFSTLFLGVAGNIDARMDMFDLGDYDLKEVTPLTGTVCYQAVDEGTAIALTNTLIARADVLRDCAVELETCGIFKISKESTPTLKFVGSKTQICHPACVDLKEACGAKMTKREYVWVSNCSEFERRFGKENIDEATLRFQTQCFSEYYNVTSDQKPVDETYEMEVGHKKTYTAALIVRVGEVSFPMASYTTVGCQTPKVHEDHFNNVEWKGKKPCELLSQDFKALYIAFPENGAAKMDVTCMPFRKNIYDTFKDMVKSRMPFNYKDVAYHCTGLAFEEYTPYCTLFKIVYKNDDSQLTVEVDQINEKVTSTFRRTGAIMEVATRLVPKQIATNSWNRFMATLSRYVPVSLTDIIQFAVNWVLDHGFNFAWTNFCNLAARMPLAGYLMDLSHHSAFVNYFEATGYLYSTAELRFMTNTLSMSRNTIVVYVVSQKLQCFAVRNYMLDFLSKRGFGFTELEGKVITSPGLFVTKHCAMENIKDYMEALEGITNTTLYVFTNQISPKYRRYIDMYADYVPEFTNEILVKALVKGDDRFAPTASFSDLVDQKKVREFSEGMSRTIKGAIRQDSIAEGMKYIDENLERNLDANKYQIAGNKKAEMHGIPRPTIKWNLPHAILRTTTNYFSGPYNEERRVTAEDIITLDPSKDINEDDIRTYKVGVNDITRDGGSDYYQLGEERVYVYEGARVNCQISTILWATKALCIEFIREAGHGSGWYDQSVYGCMVCMNIIDAGLEKKEGLTTYSMYSYEGPSEGITMQTGTVNGQAAQQGTEYKNKTEKHQGHTYFKITGVTPSFDRLKNERMVIEYNIKRDKCAENADGKTFVFGTHVAGHSSYCCVYSSTDFYMKKINSSYEVYLNKKAVPYFLNQFQQVPQTEEGHDGEIDVAGTTFLIHKNWKPIKQANNEIWKTLDNMKRIPCLETCVGKICTHMGQGGHNQGRCTIYNSSIVYVEHTTQPLELFVKPTTQVYKQGEVLLQTDTMNARQVNGYRFECETCHKMQGYSIQGCREKMATWQAHAFSSDGDSCLLHYAGVQTRVYDDHFHTEVKEGGDITVIDAGYKGTDSMKPSKGTTVYKIDKDVPLDFCVDQLKDEKNMLIAYHKEYKGDFDVCCVYRNMHYEMDYETENNTIIKYKVGVEMSVANPPVVYETRQYIFSDDKIQWIGDMEMTEKACKAKVEGDFKLAYYVAGRCYWSNSPTIGVRTKTFEESESKDSFIFFYKDVTFYVESTAKLDDCRQMLRSYQQTGNMVSVDKQVEQRDAELKKCRTEVSGLKNDNNELKNKLTALNNTNMRCNVAKEDAMKNKRTCDEEKKNCLNGATQSQNKCNERIESLEEQLSECKNNITDSVETCDEKTGLQNKVNEKIEEITTLEKKVSDKDTEIVTLSLELAQTKNKLKRLQKSFEKSDEVYQKIGNGSVTTLAYLTLETFCVNRFWDCVSFGKWVADWTVIPWWNRIINIKMMDLIYYTIVRMITLIVYYFFTEAFIFCYWPNGTCEQVSFVILYTVIIIGSIVAYIMIQPIFTVVLAAVFGVYMSVLWWRRTLHEDDKAARKRAIYNAYVAGTPMPANATTQQQQQWQQLYDQTTKPQYDTIDAEKPFNGHILIFKIILGFQFVFLH